MKSFRAYTVPALFFAWYLALSGTTVGFVDAALTTRIALEAPVEIIVPETSHAKV